MLKKTCDIRYKKKIVMDQGCVVNPPDMYPSPGPFVRRPSLGIIYTQPHNSEYWLTCYATLQVNYTTAAASLTVTIVTQLGYPPHQTLPLRAITTFTGWFVLTCTTSYATDTNTASSTYSISTPTQTNFRYPSTSNPTNANPTPPNTSNTNTAPPLNPPIALHHSPPTPIFRPT